MDRRLNAWDKLSVLQRPLSFSMSAYNGQVRIQSGASVTSQGKWGHEDAEEGKQLNVEDQVKSFMQTLLANGNLFVSIAKKKKCFWRHNI